MAVVVPRFQCEDQLMDADDPRNRRHTPARIWWALSGFAVLAAIGLAIYANRAAMPSVTATNPPLRRREWAASE